MSLRRLYSRAIRLVLLGLALIAAVFLTDNYRLGSTLVSRQSANDWLLLPVWLSCASGFVIGGAALIFRRSWGGPVALVSLVVLCVATIAIVAFRVRPVPWVDLVAGSILAALVINFWFRRWYGWRMSRHYVDKH